MTSKPKRSTKSRDSTMHAGNAEDDGNDTSSFSPNNSTRWSRQQEKEQLSNLNDRLASYIERVRNLETENNRLHIQIRDVEVVERKEKNDLAARYEAKVGDLRKQLDQVTRDKAKLEIERSKAVDGYGDLKARLDKVEKELKAAESDRVNNYEYAQGLKARLANSEQARATAEKENDILKKELAEDRKAQDVLRRQLEDEVVLRTELENRVAIFKEDLEFQRRTHASQLDEFRRKRQVEMTSYSNEIEHRYQTKLQEQLQNMRADFDSRIAQSRAEVDELYSSKLSESSYNVQKLEEKIRELQNINALMISDYQDLLDLKVQLDTELQAYTKLLEGEETRLHIAPSNTSSNLSSHGPHVSFSDPSSESTGSRRGTKRRRHDHEEEGGRYTGGFERLKKSLKMSSNAEGDVTIDEVSPDGRFIRLLNKGVADVPIGGWMIKNTGGDKEVMFKFHSRQVAKAGKPITVWSNNSGRQHSPASHIVMKNQAWPTGDAIRVELLNDDHEVVAWHELVSEFGPYTGENGTNPDDRCCIM